MAIFFNLKVVTGIVISGEFRVHKSNRGCKTLTWDRKKYKEGAKALQTIKLALCVLQISSAQWVRSQKWECDCEWSRKVLQISYSSSCSSSSFFLSFVLSFFLSHSCSSIFLLLSSYDRWIDSPNDAFEVGRLVLWVNTVTEQPLLVISLPTVRKTTTLKKKICKDLRKTKQHLYDKKNK